MSIEKFYEKFEEVKEELRRLRGDIIEKDQLLRLSKQALEPFADMAYAEPENSESNWSLESKHFKFARQVYEEI